MTCQCLSPRKAIYILPQQPTSSISRAYGYGTASRKGFHHVVNINKRLIAALKAATPAKAVDMDNAAQRITLDVIGRVGFEKDFGATEDLADGRANEAFDLMNAGGGSAHAYVPRG